MKYAGELKGWERAGLDLILTSPETEPWRQFLIDQLSSAYVTHRTMTGAGAYTDLRVSPECPLPAGAPDHFEANIVSPDKSEAVFFLLYLKKGVVAFLETAGTGSNLDIEEFVDWIN